MNNTNMPISSTDFLMNYNRVVAGTGISFELISVTGDDPTCTGHDTAWLVVIVPI